MLNLNQLRAFYCAAKNYSFTKAADELLITQPAVTAQVKHFEAFCELKLFKRKGREIYLTDEGETLFLYTRRLFEYEKIVESALDDLRQLKQGVLRIGTTTTYMHSLMPLITRFFQDNYPDIKLFLDEGSSLAMIDSLLKRSNEIAVITRVKNIDEVEFIPFAEEEVIPILSPGHPLVNEATLSVEACAREPLILRESGSGTRKFIDDLFRRHRCTPNILMETSNSELIKQLVAGGHGISFLVKETVFNYLEQKKLASVPFKDENVHIDVHIAYLRNQPLSSPAQAFLTALDYLARGDQRPINGIRSILSR